MGLSRKKSKCHAESPRNTSSVFSAEPLQSLVTELRNNKLVLNLSNYCAIAAALKKISACQKNPADPKKLESISSFPVLKWIKDVQSFVSLCSYYSRFIRNFSHISHHLIRLYQKPFKFTSVGEPYLLFKLFKICLKYCTILNIF